MTNKRSLQVMANTNWSAATAQMGSASVEAMKKGLTNTYKKLTKVSDGDIPAVSAATPTKKTPGRKRKAAAESVEGGDDGETPAKKRESIPVVTSETLSLMLI